MLTSRFLINLQQVKRSLAYGTAHSAGEMSDVAFRTQTESNIDGFIGSLGAQISFGEDEVDDDDENTYHLKETE